MSYVLLLSQIADGVFFDYISQFVMFTKLERKENKTYKDLFDYIVTLHVLPRVKYRTMHSFEKNPCFYNRYGRFCWFVTLIYKIKGTPLCLSLE